MTTTRRLAAILAADVAGYSRLMGADEEGTLARLKAHRKELIDPKTAEHRGRIVKTTGDGILIEFPSVIDAVRCAVEVQQGMQRRNAEIPEEKQIKFRVGINVGDIIIDHDDIHGDGVNIAARLESIAEPGGLCVSGRVHETCEARRYPVKQIVSMATGMPVGEFSGGKSGGQANRYADERLFRVVPLRGRNPPWMRDELMLALDLYLTHRHSLPAHESKEIADLSTLLGKLATKLGLSGDATYRNRNGVYMKLMNFRALDPEFTGQGKQGLRSTGRGDREVWKELSSHTQRCHEAALAIRAAVTSADGATAADDPDEEFAEAEEGRLLTRLHRHRERNRKLVSVKKERVLKQQGTLRCEACEFDFGKRYGKRGAGFIECHHTRPVHELAAGHKTKLADLALFAPTAIAWSMSAGPGSASTSCARSLRLAELQP